MVRLEFELIYYDVAVQLFSHDAMGTPLPYTKKIYAHISLSIMFAQRWRYYPNPQVDEHSIDHHVEILKKNKEKNYSSYNSISLFPRLDFFKLDTPLNRQNATRGVMSSRIVKKFLRARSTNQCYS